MNRPRVLPPSQPLVAGRKAQRSPLAVCALAVFVALLSAGAPQAAGVSPLPQAHAHNDYLHERPLLDALGQGFCSVEADIHLVDGQLLVAHDRSATRPGRDLETLYLAPLHERVKRNHGQVHPGHTGFTLLIDLKTEAQPTYAALKPLLAKHADMLTEFRTDGVRTQAVTVILSGDRPFDMMRQETNRWAALDGRMNNLDDSSPAALIPLVSENWSTLFTWRGNGPLPEKDLTRLNALVTKAHAQGRRIRFWGVPDGPEGWAAMQEAGVDLINTDRLAALRAFLLGSGK